MAQNIVVETEEQARPPHLSAGAREPIVLVKRKGRATAALLQLAKAPRVKKNISIKVAARVVLPAARVLQPLRVQRMGLARMLAEEVALVAHLPDALPGPVAPIRVLDGLEAVRKVLPVRQPPRRRSPLRGRRRGGRSRAGGRGLGGELGFRRLSRSPLGKLLLGHELGGSCPVAPDAGSARLRRVHARERVLLLWLRRVRVRRCAVGRRRLLRRAALCRAPAAAAQSQRDRLLGRKARGRRLAATPALRCRAAPAPAQHFGRHRPRRGHVPPPPPRLPARRAGGGLGPPPGPGRDRGHAGGLRLVDVVLRPALKKLPRANSVP